VRCAEPGEDSSPAELKARLRAEIDDVARLQALQGCEIPRDIIVEVEPFSKENCLLTDSGKLATGRLKKRCGRTTY
jgi:fatty acid CoA ligase FadD9